MPRINRVHPSTPPASNPMQMTYAQPVDFAFRDLSTTQAIHLVAGGGNGSARGLTVAGIIAVVGAINTYLSGLSAAGKAAVAAHQDAGGPQVIVSASQVQVPVAPGDLATFGATLAGVLTTAGNVGVLPS